MKVDRLLEIIIYLMNHTSATARQLADKFGVSVRTIQRDMTSLSLSGIPIASEAGSHGGYFIMSDYKLKNQFVTDDDFSLIVTALKSLSTAFENSRLQSILDKYHSITTPEKQDIFLDYSVAKENTKVLGYTEIIKSALKECVEVTFDYKNAAGLESKKQVQPVALRFKWYAWYLYAFDKNRNDYRTYKLARIGNLKKTGIVFHPEKNTEQLLEEADRKYLQTCECITIRCRSDAITELEEYFPGEEKVKEKDGSYTLYLRVPPGEKLWPALLLGMGGKITVISPDYYRNKLIKTAQDFLSNYDTQLS